MNKMARIVTLPSLVLLACALPAAAAPQPEGKRIALIIGNNAYSISPLQNAVNDARALDKALRGAGFQTILRENAGKTAMEEATAEFLQQLGPDDTALFFYAGHPSSSGLHSAMGKWHQRQKGGGLNPFFIRSAFSPFAPVERV